MKYYEHIRIGFKVFLWMIVGFTAQKTLLAQIDVSIMSFNIRLDVESDRENRWDLRKEQVAGLMNFYEADFIGAQEVQHHQLQFLLNNMPAYDFIGVGRDDGIQAGEYSPVLYKKDKFQVMQHGTFWLSATPDSVSFGWDAVCRRVCSYGIFKEKKTGQHVLVLNTHLDHIGKKARVESVKLILEKIKEINVKHYPVLLTGDFNVQPNDEPIQIVTAQLANARTICKTIPLGSIDTWNGFKFQEKPVGCIDYIFVDKGNDLSVLKFITISHSYNLKYPSDHFPVMATLRISKD